MWAQVIEMKLEAGRQPSETIRRVADLAAAFRAAEQPGSGLVRSQFMRDQSDPTRIIASGHRAVDGRDRVNAESYRHRDSRGGTVGGR